MWYIAHVAPTLQNRKTTLSLNVRVFAGPFDITPQRECWSSDEPWLRHFDVGGMAAGSKFDEAGMEFLCNDLHDVSG